jgi:hypothetical protein
VWVAFPRPSSERAQVDFALTFVSGVMRLTSYQIVVQLVHLHLVLAQGLDPIRCEASCVMSPSPMSSCPCYTSVPTRKCKSFHGNILHEHQSLVNLQSFPYFCLSVMEWVWYGLQETPTPSTLTKRKKIMWCIFSRDWSVFSFPFPYSHSLFLGSHDLITQWLPSPPSQ